jgi:drug/metabolite transporter (DMT)-like permease
VPTLQTIPVFGFALGYIILGETLSGSQIVGSLIIIIGAVLLSMEIQANGRVQIRKRDLSLALASSLLFALSGVIFKLIAISHGYWATEFWEYVGIATVGICLFFVNEGYRRKFVGVIQDTNMHVIGINFATELIMVTSDLLLNFATLLTQVALVYTVNSFQPAFLFVYGIFGAIVSPKSAMLPKIDKKLYIKGLVILLMICGAILLHS